MALDGTQSDVEVPFGGYQAYQHAALVGDEELLDELCGSSEQGGRVGNTGRVGGRVGAVSARADSAGAGGGGHGKYLRSLVASGDCFPPQRWGSRARTPILS